MADITRRLHAWDYDSRFDVSYAVDKAFLYTGETGRDPWFMKPIFEAVPLAKVKVSDGAPVFISQVTNVLSRDADFITRARRFCEENNQPYKEGMISRLVRTYLTIIPKEVDLGESPYHPKMLYKDSFIRSLYAYPGENDHYRYITENGAEPWYMKSVFQAFAHVLKAGGGRYNSYAAARSEVLGILTGDRDFVAAAQEFYEQHGLIFDGKSVARLMDTYCYILRNDNVLYNSLYGHNNLKQILYRAKPKSYSEENAQLVHDYLGRILPAGNFQTPQAASFAVFLAMQKAGVSITERKVRQIITQEANADHERFSTLLKDVKPDAYDAGDENEGKIETTFTRPVGSPTGSFSSTQSARRRP